MNDGKGPFRPPRGPKSRDRSGRRRGGADARHTRRPPAAVGEAGRPWIYGLHAVTAALANPDRRCRRLLATDTAATGLETGDVSPEIVARAEIDALLPPGAVHQGLALLADPLPTLDVPEIVARLEGRARSALVALDQVTDPQNVGAVMRSAAAFGADALIAPDRHAPEATGALAKAASGALESVAILRPTNLVRALENLKDAGFWIVGLDMSAPQALAAAPLPDRCVLVVGAEGSGLRRLTRETCDLLVRVPIDGRMESLNVSATAAVTLYEWARGR